MEQSIGDCLRNNGDDVKYSCLWESFNKLRVHQQLCDVTLLSSNGVRFPAHKVILAANSPYFRALFTNDMKETGEKEVKMSIHSRYMDIIINYIYTRKARINMENVMTVLPHSDSFLISGLVDLCTRFLKASLSATNCLAIRRFALSYHLQDLATASWGYLLSNFMEVAENGHQLQQLEGEELVELYSNDRINVKSEEELFEVAVHWIDFWVERRIQYLPQLLRHIRLGLIQTDYFMQKVSCHSLVLQINDECETIIRDAWEFLYSFESIGHRTVDLNNPLVRPRVPHDVIFVVGGWSAGSPIAGVETYDTRADRWYTQEALDDVAPRAYHGLEVVDRKVYVIGGFDGTQYYNSVRCLDPVTKVWSDVAPMYTQRCYVSTAAANGHIYACGGYDGRLRLASGERYDPCLNQWTVITDMRHRRSDAGATDIQGKVYVVGGFDGESCLDSAEVFCPDTNQWTVLPGMVWPRSGVAVASLHGELYALGGFDGERRLLTGERYSPIADRWEALPDMYVPRSNFAVAVLEEMIFVVGGFNGNVTIRHVECFDAEGNEWLDATDMVINRSALKACVVRGLPNVLSYTYHGLSGDH